MSSTEPAPAKRSGWISDKAAYWADKARRRQASIYRRSLVQPLFTDTLANRAFHWVLPWGDYSYPGRLRGLPQLFAKRVSYRAIRYWVTEKRRTPAWALHTLAGYIEARCLTGLALVAELRTLAAAREAEGHKPRGFQIMDPVTGLDRRGRGGQNRKRPKEPDSTK